MNIFCFRFGNHIHTKKTTTGRYRFRYQSVHGLFFLMISAFGISRKSLDFILDQLKQCEGIDDYS